MNIGQKEQPVVPNVPAAVEAGGVDVDHSIEQAHQEIAKHTSEAVGVTHNTQQVTAPIIQNPMDVLLPDELKIGEKNAKTEAQIQETMTSEYDTITLGNNLADRLFLDKPGRTKPDDFIAYREQREAQKNAVAEAVAEPEQRSVPRSILSKLFGRNENPSQPAVVETKTPAVQQESLPNQNIVQFPTQGVGTEVMPGNVVQLPQVNEQNKRVA